MSHEFFHLWNVKRIRSKPLGPFDYQQLPQTGALWWLEGTTDYFAHLLLNRYGWFDGKEMREQIARNLGRQRARPERFQISPYQASYRVREANNGRGNSDGYLVSYYDTGFLAGLCLDIEILSQTGGKRSLDDVERSLWRICRNDRPGFEEGEIRTQCVTYGGPALGAFYDQVVMQPGELPIESQLAKVGLKLVKGSESVPDLGFDVAPASGALTVSRVSDRWGGLKTGDEIREINGVAVQGASFMSGAWRNAIGALKPGDAVKLKIVRMTSGNPTDMAVDGSMGSVSRDTFTVEDDPSASASAKALYKIWMAKRR
jgi:predicted metalloprotease with PDZ domain